MSNWRTSTVVELCASMRQTQDYSAAPILADALADADYPDEAVLAALRDAALPRWRAEQLVATLYSDESAEAVKWLKQFVRDINYNDYPDDATDDDRDSGNGTPSDTYPHDYEYVIEQGRVACGLTQNERGSPNVMCFGSDAGANYFRESKENVRRFFENWQLATGLKGPPDLNQVGYRCAC